MAASVDWSSLPYDLINRIADCLLATNDIDYYMHLRAVCSTWRSATTNTKNNPDKRFRPLEWIVIDEVGYSLDVNRGTRLLVNKTTGRFLRKDLPMLNRYYVVTSGPYGFFVLADREPPHAVSVYNPFTGYLFRFKAPMVDEAVDSVAIFSVEHAPILILFCDSSRKLYQAKTDSGYFDMLEDDKAFYPMIRMALIGMMYMSSDEGDKFIPQLMSFMNAHPDKMLSVYPSETGSTSCWFIVGSAGKTLLIIKLEHSVEVFWWNTDGGGVFEPIKSIGNHAIFLGHRKCLSVNADKFPSIDGNCIYYLKSLDPCDIYMYDLKYGKDERVCGAINPINCIPLSDAAPPFTIIQLLSSFTTNAWDSERIGQKSLEGLRDVIPDTEDSGLPRGS